MRQQLTARSAPTSTTQGPETVACRLIAAGDNPDRMHSDASFAALCGANPIQGRPLGPVSATTPDHGDNHQR